jgi:hypothetical protein
MQASASRHAQQDLPVHGFDGAFVMTMFTAPVSPKAFSKCKNASCSLKDCYLRPCEKMLVYQGFSLGTLNAFTDYQGFMGLSAVRMKGAL